MTRRKSITSLTEKPCITCHTTLPMDQFPRDKRNIDGHRETCLACEEQHRLSFPQEKPCTKCGNVKPLDEYPLDKRNPDGHWNMCKGCIKQRREIHYAEHGETIRAKRRAHYAEHTEEAHTYNIEHSAEKKAWREDNKEKLRLYFKQRYAADPGKFKDYQRQLRIDNPEKERERASAKRAHRAQAPINDLSEAQFKEICQAYHFRCAYCQKKDKHLTKDHVTPYKHNGSNTLWNIVPACHRCNSTKRTGLPPVPVQPLLLTLAAARKPK